MHKLIKDKTEYTSQEIVSLLKITDPKALEDLYQLADETREKYMGNAVQVRAVINFSNNCCRNCLYCGIRRSNDKIQRFKLDENAIIELAQKAEKSGYKSIILKSGEDLSYSSDILERIIRKIRQTTKLVITLSIGERPEIEYRLFREAGADSYLLKHETSDPILYRQLHPDLKYSNRIKCLGLLKTLNFDTGSGIMVGIPGQTFESIANDIYLFRSMDIDKIIIAPYLPHPDTPLAKKFEQAGGYFAPAIGYFDVEEMVYKIMAITRIVTKRANIPVTSALTLVSNKNARELALKRGANVVMINVTESDVREYYQIYSTKADLVKGKLISRKEIEEMIVKLKREPL